MSVPVLVSVLTCVLVVCALDNKVDFEEGDTCKEVNGIAWTCKKIPECRKAIKILQRFQHPEICGFQGKESLVCCEPSIGEKAEQMCKRYSELVLIGNHNDTSDVGVQKHKLAGGEPADPKEFPHMALIEFEETDSTQPICGGSLISDKFVLSAAHCSYSFAGKPKWVRLGDYNINSNNDERFGQSKPVKYEIVENFTHPDYRSPQVYNDIILYKLNTSVQYTKFVKPLCLNTEYLTPDGKYIATGWGIEKWGGNTSHNLQKVNLAINSRQECVDYYTKNRRENIKGGIRDEMMICAGGNGKGICEGDSGGPFQVRHPLYNNMYLQVGIASSGQTCQFNDHDVYTRVSHYISWIESVVWSDGDVNN